MNSERNIIDCYNMMDIPLRHVIIQINLFFSEILRHKSKPIIMKHFNDPLSTLGLILTLFALTLYSCSDEPSASEIEPQIMTVTGPIPIAELGTTLAHEHVLVDWIGADSTGYHRWD